MSVELGISIKLSRQTCQTKENCEDIKPYKDEWRLTLKLLLSWKQNNSFGGDTLEGVLVDETVKYIFFHYIYIYIYRFSTNTESY